MKPVEEQAGLPGTPPTGDLGMRAWMSVLTTRLTTFLRALAYRTNAMLPKDGTEGLTPYTVATRPTPTSGQFIYVSDGAVGARFQGSHAGAWVNLG